MAGFWNLGLKMIPTDRPRSSFGPPGDYGQTKICVAKTTLFLILLFQENMKMVDEHGWMSDFRAETDTK